MRVVCRVCNAQYDRHSAMAAAKAHRTVLGAAPGGRLCGRCSQPFRAPGHRGLVRAPVEVGGGGLRGLRRCTERGTTTRGPWCQSGMPGLRYDGMGGAAPLASGAARVTKGGSQQRIPTGLPYGAPCPACGTFGLRPVLGLRLRAHPFCFFPCAVHPSLCLCLWVAAPPAHHTTPHRTAPHQPQSYKPKRSLPPYTYGLHVARDLRAPACIGIQSLICHVW